MVQSGQKKISRRDAMKILAAAVGAATVANLPPEWSKPGLETGVLPAHAQTSTNLTAGPDTDVNQCDADFTSTVSIAPARANVPMHYVITTFTNFGSIIITTPSSLTGTVLTNASGVASLFIHANGIYLGTVTITWSFENPADGSGSDSQVFSAPNAPC